MPGKPILVNKAWRPTERWIRMQHKADPNGAKAGGLQSPRKRDFRFAPTSVKGEAVIGYRNPLTMRVVDPVGDGNLKSSNSPGR